MEIFLLIMLGILLVVFGVIIYAVCKMSAIEEEMEEKMRERDDD